MMSTPCSRLTLLMNSVALELLPLTHQFHFFSVCLFFFLFTNHLFAYQHHNTVINK